MSPLELRASLSLLRLERIAAAQCGLSRCPQYMADLDAEEAECVEALTIATVTEIATLRRELYGRAAGRVTGASRLARRRTSRAR